MGNANFQLSTFNLIRFLIRYIILKPNFISLLCYFNLSGALAHQCRNFNFSLGYWILDIGCFDAFDAENTAKNTKTNIEFTIFFY